MLFLFVGQPDRVTQGRINILGLQGGILAQDLGVRFSGIIAWLLWRVIYLSKLPGPQKKVRVALDWTLDLFFAKDFACVTEPSLKAVPLQSGIQETIAEKQMGSLRSDAILGAEAPR